MRAPILNRSGEIPADGWYQIEVTGEHPAGAGRKQVIDDVALFSIVNRFQAEAEAENFAGMLVDNDHLSHDLTQSTAALSWAKELAVRDGQLHARLELTDLGDTAIRHKRFKFFSTEYDPEDLQDLGGGRVRPLRLAGLAFTNRPNNRGGKPISNRTDPATETETTNNMQTIAQKLGLDPAASEADILAAIDALLAYKAAAETKEATTEAEAIMNRMGNRIPEAVRPQWRDKLIANRAETEPLMEASFPVIEENVATQRIHNRAGVTTPPPVGDADRAAETAREVERVKLVNSIRNRDATTFERAWETGKIEKPELF
jgi:hypothetical protein